MHSDRIENLHTSKSYSAKSSKKKSFPRSRVPKSHTWNIPAYYIRTDINPDKVRSKWWSNPNVLPNLHFRSVLIKRNSRWVTCKHENYLQSQPFLQIFKMIANVVVTGKTRNVIQFSNQISVVTDLRMKIGHYFICRNRILNHHRYLSTKERHWLNLKFHINLLQWIQVCWKGICRMSETSAVGLCCSSKKRIYWSLLMQVLARKTWICAIQLTVRKKWQEKETIASYMKCIKVKMRHVI